MRIEDGIAIGVGIGAGIAVVKGLFDLFDQIQKQQRIQQQMNLRLHYRLQTVENQFGQHNSTPHLSKDDLAQGLAGVTGELRLQAARGYAPDWTDPDAPSNGNGHYPEN